MEKIVIFSNTSWYLYNFKKEIIACLKSAGFRCVICAPWDRYSDQFVKEGYEFIPCEFSSKSQSLWDNITLYRQYRKIIARERPDVTLTFTIKPNIFTNLASRNKTRQIVTITGLGSALLRGKGVKTYLIQHLFKWALKKSDCVLFQNSEDRSYFLENNIIKEKKSHLIGSGIDLEKFKPVYHQEKEIRFLMVARLLKDKGVVEYLEAAQYVSKKMHEVKFVLIGPLWLDNPSGISKQYLDRYCAENPNFLYLGECDSCGVETAMKQASCVVLPSYKEGMSRTLLEGAAYGRPLIATDVSGCREIVFHKHNGYLCKPRNSYELILAMEAFCKLPVEVREAMGKASRRVVETTFDQDKINQIYLNFVKLVEN